MDSNKMVADPTRLIVKLTERAKEAKLNGDRRIYKTLLNIIDKVAENNKVDPDLMVTTRYL